jgi:prepilin-type N-terminal cleavage/methylation domain-containing protein/prepilin-type processing-associated H-X9-DG protein
MSQSSHRRLRAFTLIELLVVIAIIAVLAAIAFPGYKSMLENSRAATCTSNLREIYTGIQGYVMENNGQYPPANRLPNNPNNYWFGLIGPYLSEGRRFDQAKVNPANPVLQKIPFACPSCANHGWGGAGLDMGINAFQVGGGIPNLSPPPPLRAAKVSSPSSTLLVADAVDANTGVGSWGIGWRTPPNHVGFPAQRIATRHKGRANVLYFDGHVGQVTAEQLQVPEFVEKLGGPRF